MIPRYAPQQIAKIFSDTSRLQRWLDVELLACEGWAELGRIPVEALTTLRGATIDTERIAELEAEQGHDMAAFVAAVQETVGDAGRYFHLGLTSSDVVDTALATQLRDAAGVIDSDVDSLIGALVEQAERHRLTVMMGRTHGVHAEPLTLGIKLANFVDEVRRARSRLSSATAEIAVGQITGAVGTPRPHSRRGPKVCIGAGGKRMLSFAAREADIVAVNATMTAGALDASVAATASPAAFDEKISWVRAAATAAGRVDEIELQCHCPLVTLTDDRASLLDALAPAFGCPSADAADIPLTMVGTIDEMCEAIVCRRDRWGFTYTIVPDDAMETFAPVVAELAGRS